MMKLYVAVAADHLDRQTVRSRKGHLYAGGSECPSGMALDNRMAAASREAFWHPLNA